MNLGIGTSDFSLLPAHIITHILRYLKIHDFKTSSSVCKSWYYASTDPQIVRTLILQPKFDHFIDICKSDRRYGILKLKSINFSKVDSSYFELLEKFCPFIRELHISDSVLKIDHLRTILQLTTCLEVFSFSGCHLLDDNTKSQIVTSLSTVKSITIEYVNNIPLIADLVRAASNLNTIGISIFIPEFDGHAGNIYKAFFTIFDHCNVGNLRHLNLNLDFHINVDDFIIGFVKIQNLNLTSLRLILRWNWDGGFYKSSLFEELLIKLQSLVEFIIDGELKHDQLSLICRHLGGLKSLDCHPLDTNQPICELAKLKHLEKLRCRFSNNRDDDLIGTDRFCTVKFNNLRVLNFQGFLTETNLLRLCENHPDLIDLRLTRLLTQNLEIIFKHLTKLRVLKIQFGLKRIRDVTSLCVNHEYVYKVSRLQDLEELYLGKMVNGICEADVRELKKLVTTNLSLLFGKRHNVWTI